MPSDPVKLALSKVKKPKRAGSGWSFRCPSHDDKKESGALYRAKDGGAIIKCFAGCSTKQICEAPGITTGDLQASSFQAARTRVRAAYPYYDASGQMLYEHLRMAPTQKNPKSFLRM